MFRIGLKFPCNDLSRVYKVKKHGYPRLYLTARYYETRARVKYDHEERLCKDVPLTSRLSTSKYSTGSSQSAKSGGSKTFIVLSAVTLGTIGVLSYAKSNPEIRNTLEDWIPGTNKVIQIIFLEENTYLNFIHSFFESIKTSISGLFMGQSKEEQKSAPKPVLGPLVTEKTITKQVSSVTETPSEVRSNKEKSKKESEIGKVETSVAQTSKATPEISLPTNMAELEKHCGEIATKAIKAYQEATIAIKEHNEDIHKITENVTAVLNVNQIQRMKDTAEKLNGILNEAEKLADETLKSVKMLHTHIDDPKFDAPTHVKLAVKANVRKILDDVDKAKKKYEAITPNKDVPERVRQQVEAARNQFGEELNILFPQMDNSDKNLVISGKGFDLFMLHMFNKINHLQTELNKLQAFSEGQLKAALTSKDDELNKEKLDALIALETEKQKRILEEEFSKKLLLEQKTFQEELRRQLKLQSEVHADHLREALVVKEREAQRAASLAINEIAEAESIKYKTQLAAIIGRLRGFEAALKARLEEEKGANEVQLLWSACQALARAIKTAPPGTTKGSTLRPLEPEIKAVCKAAPKNDPLVLTTLESIPEEAMKRGVFPEDALRERFLKVEDMARKLALVPEGGAPLPVYLLSYLQNFLIINTSHLIPKSEIDDEPVDVESFNTFDVLNRARYWLDRGDFKMTLRYMNLLKGASRSVARDWMNETRILLETQQAIDTLLAYAGASGLLLLGGGDAKPTKK